jgi:hypothetical protein
MINTFWYIYVGYFEFCFCWYFLGLIVIAKRVKSDVFESTFSKLEYASGFFLLATLIGAIALYGLTEIVYFICSTFFSR